jgi:hypothetical protein
VQPHRFGLTQRIVIGILVGNILACSMQPFLRSPAIVLAAQSCEGGLHYYFDGTYPIATTSYAISAGINTYVPNLCTTNNSNSDSSVWTMLAGQASSDGWAQSGYGRHSGQTTAYEFAQTCGKYNTSTQTCTSGFAEWDGPAVSGTHTYSQVYNFNTGRINMEVDGTVELTTSFDPITTWTGPWIPEWEGETHDIGDDMPGTLATPVHFSNMQIQTCRSGCYTQAPAHSLSSSNYTRYANRWYTQYSNAAIWSVCDNPTCTMPVKGY